MDVSTSATSLPSSRCQSLNNALLDRPGHLRAQLQLVDALPAVQSAPIDNVWYYFGVNNALDAIVFMSGSALYSAFYADRPTVHTNYTPAYPPLFGTPTVPGNATNVTVAGVRNRAAQFGNELIVTNDAFGAFPQFIRFFVGASGSSGLVAPLTYNNVLAGTVFSLTAASGSIPVGLYTYYFTIFDNLGRESNISTGTSITLGSPASVNISLTPFPGAATDPGYGGYNIYRTTVNQTSPAYLVASTNIIAGVFTFNDNLADNVLTGGILAPSLGENSSPNQANVICNYKNRLWLNDTTNNSVLQISGLGNPAQFSILTYTGSDGERLTVGNNQGDPIVALVPLSAFLLVFRRQETYLIRGDGIASVVDAAGTALLDFTSQPLLQRGCIAPDSAINCDNSCIFLAQDGIYVIDPSGGVNLVSEPLDPYFQAFNSTPAGRALLNSSVARYDGRRYCLQVGVYCFVLDLRTGGWVTWGFGEPLYGYQLATGVIPGVQQ